MPCERLLACGHKCLERCYVRPCRCHCFKGNAKALPTSHSHSPPAVSEAAKAYQAYANGGHVEADAKLTEAAKDLAAKRLQQKADDDMARALFGTDGAWSSASASVDGDKAEARLVEITAVGHGQSRGKWKEVYDGGVSSGTTQDSQPLISLLD